MRALLLEKYNELELRDVPIPEPGHQDVLIRVKACGICGSDVHGYDSSTGRRIPPLIMGHEASGIVHSAGRDVRNFKPGDRVTFDSTISCGACRFCAALSSLIPYEARMALVARKFLSSEVNHRPRSRPRQVARHVQVVAQSGVLPHHGKSGGGRTAAFEQTNVPVLSHFPAIGDRCPRRCNARASTCQPRSHLSQRDQSSRRHLEVHAVQNSEVAVGDGEACAP